MRGGTPAVAQPSTRPRGFRPWVLTAASLASSSAQALAVVRELGIADDDARVNPNGGAIAIGHPLGASGARLATTALRQLERSGGRYGVASMCIGVGQGIAMLIERV